MKTTGFNSLNSWLVTLACSAMLLLTHIPFKVAAMLYVAFPDRYLTDRPNAVLFILVITALRSFGGPLTGYFGQIFTLRSLTVVGCFLAAFGVGICYVAEDIIIVNIALGLIYGIGFTLSSTLFPQILKQHFTKNISIAVGISYVGGSIGGFATIPAFKMLLDFYGVSGALLITSAIMLNAVPMAMLMWDPKYKKEQVSKDYTDRLKDPSNNKDSRDIEPLELVTFLTTETSKNQVNNLKKEDDGMLLKDPVKRHGICAKESPEVIKLLSIKNSISDDKQTNNLAIKSVKPKYNVVTKQDLNDAKNQEQVLIKDVKQEFVDAKSDGIFTDSKQKQPASSSDIGTTIKCKKQAKHRRALKSFVVFKNPVFLVIMLCQSILLYTLVFVITIVTDISRDKDVSQNNEVFLLMGITLSETLGFTCLGWITDKGYLSVSNFMALFCFFMGISCMLFAIATNFTVLMVASFGFGLSVSATSSANPSLVYAFIEEELQTMAIASRLALYVPLSFTMGPLIGYFRGTLGSYEGALYMLTAFSLGCAILQLFLPCIKRLTDRKLQYINKN